eukprot:5604921-Amphidinium_carterae.1
MSRSLLAALQKLEAPSTHTSIAAKTTTNCRGATKPGTTLTVKPCSTRACPNQAITAAVPRQQQQPPIRDCEENATTHP